MFQLPFLGLLMFLSLPCRAATLMLVAYMRLTCIQPFKSKLDLAIIIVRFKAVRAYQLSTCILLALPLLATTFFPYIISFVFSYSTLTIRVAAIICFVFLGT